MCVCGFVTAVYVVFREEEEAEKALMALNGRFYAGLCVSVCVMCVCERMGLGGGARREIHLCSLVSHVHVPACICAIVASL